MENTRKKSTLITIIILGICILLSLFALRPAMQSDKAQSYSINYLNEKEKTVLKTTAVSATTSVVLAAIPSDATTPIAEKLADVTGYMAGILVIVYLEKYIVSVAGTFTATWLIPVSLGLLIFYLIFRKKWLQSLGIRILLLSALLTCIVPLSVAFSKSVENAYQDNLEKATAAIQLTEDAKTTESNKKSESSSESSDSNNSKNVWEIIQDTLNDVGEKAANAAESVKVSVSEITDRVVDAANNFVQVVAIMILTSFLVPLIIFILFLWALKLIFKVSSGGSGAEYKQLTNKMNELETKLKA